MQYRLTRLAPTDTDIAQRLFALMARIFDEEYEPLSDAYVEKLLSNDGFWALAAFAGKDIVGGITAHTLPMTRTASFELFVYDIAIREDHQRRGLGRGLVTTAALGRSRARNSTMSSSRRTEDDTHALDFYRALGGTGAAVTMFSFGRLAAKGAVRRRKQFRSLG